MLELVNAGHMNPVLVRDEKVSEIHLDAGLALGVAPDEAYTHTSSSPAPTTGYPW